ncbi:MAG: NfeD family protein [Planctomycetota bacterium]
MTQKSGRFLVLVTAAAISAWLLPLLMADQQDTPAPAKSNSATDSPEKIAAIITCHDMIDDGLYQSIIRRSEEAVSRGADYLILDVQTYGGLVKSADDISKYLILELGDKIHTVAYVSTEAISAGSMISVSCKDIIMRKNTTIGCSAPIVMGSKEMGETEREKSESFVRATFSRAAQANRYPEALLKAMVSQKIEVWQVENIKSGQMEYFEKEFLPTDPNAFDIANKKLIVKEGELLTLTDQKAKKYGIARAVVEDIDGTLAFLAERDGISFSKDVIRLETMWSEELVRWLSSPMVVSILILGIMLGIYVEFNTPGLGLPAMLAVTCLVILVGSRYLIGMANWIEIALLAIGFLLLMVEIFVIPGFGVAGFAGIVCIVGGLLAMWVKNAPDEIPWPKGEAAWTIFTDGLAAMALGFLAFLGVAVVLARYMDRIPLLRSFVLKAAVTGKQTDISQTTVPKPKPLPLKIGQMGEVLSALRPAGKVRFDDDIVDAVSDGDYIETGRQVKVQQINGNHVVVSEIKNT